MLASNRNARHLRCDAIGSTTLRNTELGVRTAGDRRTRPPTVARCQPNDRPSPASRCCGSSPRSSSCSRTCRRTCTPVSAHPWSTSPSARSGVTVFFAISGFVAVLVTQRTPRPTWRGFLRRRLVRILPLAWAVMTIKLVTLLVAPQALERAATSPTYIVSSYLFLPSRGPNGVVEPFFTVTWTLSFELLFYVVVTIALATRSDPLRLASVVFVGLAVASAFRGPDGWPTWQFHANRIVLCFLVGMVIGRWALDRRTRLALLRTAAITAIWLVVGTVAGASVPSLLLLPLAAAALATTVVGEPLLRRCTGTVGRTLGDASYALYLTHPILAPATVAVVAAVVSGPAAPIVAGIAAPVAAVAASVVVWFAVDRPVIRRLQRRRTAPPRTPRAARHPATRRVVSSRAMESSELALRWLRLPRGLRRPARTRDPVARGRPSHGRRAPDGQVDRLADRTMGRGVRRRRRRPGRRRGRRDDPRRPAGPRCARPGRRARGHRGPQRRGPRHPRAACGAAGTTPGCRSGSGTPSSTRPGSIPQRCSPVTRTSPGASSST
ncbi:acyltransferase [Curtobacterium flaccumfaciens]|nr:acyltransferase [Curtobacterium flaccumfaciens]